MARKVADLRNAMQASAKAAPRQLKAVVEPATRVEQPQTYPENPHYRPGRARKSNVTGYFPPDVKKQLRILAAERETTIHGLRAEAMNDLVAQYVMAEDAHLY